MVTLSKQTGTEIEATFSLLSFEQLLQVRALVAQRISRHF